MRFFKNNSYDIVKLFINQIGIAIFSMMLYSSVSLIDLNEYKTPLYALISVFSMLFYFSLLYTAAWDFGAKDKIRLEGGRAVDGMREGHIPAKGALLALFANIPNLLLVGLAIIFESISLLGGPEGFNTAFVLLNNFFRFLLSMYLGLIRGIFSFLGDTLIGYFYQAIAYFFAPLLAIGATQLGYSFGYREFRISSLFSSKENGK